MPCFRLKATPNSVCLCGQFHRNECSIFFTETESDPWTRSFNKKLQRLGFAFEGQSHVS